MSVASRALAPARSRAITTAKPAVRDSLRGAAGLLNNGKWESLPFFVYGGVCSVVVAFRVIADTDGERFVGVIFGLLALAAGALLVKGVSEKAAPNTLTACACVCAASAWLAGAAAAPLSLGLFLTGLIVTAGLGVPYWVHLAKHRKPGTPTYVSVEGKTPEAPVDEFADVKGLTGSRWEAREKTTTSGTVRPLKIAKGLDARAVIESKAGAIAGLLDARYDDVELVETDRASVIDVYHHTKDLLAQPLRWPLLDNPRWDILAPIPVGCMRTGDQAEISLEGKHLLIGGESGSGKSTLMAALAIMATMDPNCDVWLIDGKRVELSFWRHAAKGYVQDSTADAANLLRAVQDEVTRRYDEMAKNKWRKIAESGGRIGPMILFIDELPRFLRDTGASDKEKDDFVNRLKDLLDRGRAAGLSVIATAQRPSAAQFKNGDLRAGFTQRVAFRCADSDGSRMILGDGAGVDASKIPQEKRGVAYLSGVAGPVRQIRTYWIDDDTVKALAEKAEPEAYQWGTVLPAEAHFELPAGEDIASTASFPDGSPIPSGWRLSLWEMLTDESTGTTALVEAMPVGRKPVTDTLKEWEAAGYITSEAAKGGAFTWRKC